MNKRMLSAALVTLLGAGFSPAGRSQTPGASRSGVIINATCTVDEAFAEAAKCTASTPGARLALYDDTIRQVYALEPQEQAQGHLGDSVTVEGQLDGATLHIASLKMFSAVGLRTGDPAPDFSASDQFGKTQSLQSLRGRNGTILLFYRSADWCPYCKGQLIQLQAAKARFEKEGISLAGVSYDSVEQSDRMAVPGNLITLTAEVRLPPDVHVYAPGTKGYKTVKLSIDPLPDFETRKADYPAAKILYLPAIQERVPVFQGTFRIRQELKVNSMAEFSGALGADGKKVTVKGTLEYQACDSKICFLPAAAPLEWHLEIMPLDRQRAPEEIRHK